MRKQLIATDVSSIEEAGFTFRHVLIRDAAYESLTKEDRAEHARAVRGLARGSPSRADDRARGDRRLPSRAGPTAIAPSSAGGRTRAFALAQRAAQHLAAAGRRAVRAREDTAAASLLRPRRRAAARVGSGTACAASAIGESLEGTANHATAGEVYEEALEARGRGRRAARRGPGPPGAGARVVRRRPGDQRVEIVAETERAIALLEGDRRRARARGGLAAGRRGPHVRGSGRGGPAGARTGARSRRARHRATDLERDLLRDRACACSTARRRSNRPPSSPASASPRHEPAACARWRPTCCTCWASPRGDAGVSTRPRETLDLLHRDQRGARPALHGAVVEAQPGSARARGRRSAWPPSARCERAGTC